MPRPKPDKSELLAALARHVLDHGLNTASLRPMAAAVGTSDRMLIYHFESKERLIGELLQCLARDMAQMLDAALPPRRIESEALLVRRIVRLVRSKPFHPYVRVWLDIVSAAAQGQKAHKKAGAAIIQYYLDWIAVRHPEGRVGAPAVLALIEGVLILDAMNHTRTADLAISRLSR